MNPWILDTAIARLLSTNAVVLTEQPNSQMVRNPEAIVTWLVEFLWPDNHFQARLPPNDLGAKTNDQTPKTRDLETNDRRRTISHGVQWKISAGRIFNNWKFSLTELKLDLR
jgi:hypothetical protein